jgi:hypothetical protein
MKPCYLIYIFFISIFSLALSKNTRAQKVNCNFKNQIYTLDFGNRSSEKIFNLAALKNYTRTEDMCPEDGYYGYLSSIGDCFESKWHKIMADHTPGDKEGKMMVVNASFEPGPFFLFKLAGLKAGTVYEWSAWVINICKSADGCIPTPPVLRLTMLSGSTEIAKFKTAPLVTMPSPVWLKQSGTFTVPEGVYDITIYMEDITEGGCGNDFALDDFILKECSNKQTPPSLKITPIASSSEEQPKEKLTDPKPGNAIKDDIKQVDSLNKINPNTQAKNEIPLSEKPATVERRPEILLPPVPKPISSRLNPIIKKIETEETEMTIQLFDNGQIDGDTVSIFHNNRQIVDRAGLSVTPVTVKIKVDKLHPHHELVMVAENLGSIPPNTSLMIITTKNNRYELFITSTEQKNAKIIIDLADN